MRQLMARPAAIDSRKRGDGSRRRQGCARMRRLSSWRNKPRFFLRSFAAAIAIFVVSDRRHFDPRISRGRDREKIVAHFSTHRAFFS
jgi:hypothetical protein